MQQKKWVYKCALLKRDDVSELAATCGLPLVLATLLLNRGMGNAEALKKYIKKPLDCIHNPMLMPNMAESCERIKSAIEKHEKITVYGDYDADGVTSTTILYSFLKSLSADVDYYIPDRFSEGYGLNIMAVNRISKSGTKLLITVDCGIVSTGEVQLAKAQGVDVIITDHHTPQEKLPETLIVHPAIDGSQYPFGQLAGVGVVFKLVLALGMSFGMSFGMKSSEIFARYVGIAAIGTIADVVPLKDENRVIVDRGIRALSKTDNYGIRALTEIAGLNEKTLNSTSLAFGISPRINAAGRMGSARDAVELLLAPSYDEAYKMALELDSKNRQRQATEKKILEQAQKLIDSDCNFEKKKVIVLSGEGWHHGVIGIAASRICEKYYKPCIMLSEENGLCKGSARSIPGFSMFDALTHCKELLTKFGGHSQAAGLSLSAADVDKFSDKINKYADSVLTDEDMIKTIELDCRINPEELNMDFAAMLSMLEPFGEGNERPVFAAVGCVAAAVARIGADGKHLRMKLRTRTGTLGCVGFGMGDAADEIHDGERVDVAFCVDINEFNGVRNVQLMLKDVRRRKFEDRK